MAEKIASLIVDLEEEKTVAAVRRALDEGVEPLALVEELREGMSEVGRRFEEKEYYLSELIMSAEIFKQAIELIEAKLGRATEASKGSVVVGTVKGDIHDIGKNIVASLLRCDGFDVHDLGVDVSPGAFVSKLRETGAKLLALSGLLTMAFDAMKETVEAVSGAALRDSVKIIIGGGPVNESVVEFTGADAYGKDAGEAVRLASKFLG
jgi:methanogenic corrinoid protein MtbC1